MDTARPCAGKTRRRVRRARHAGTADGEGCGGNRGRGTREGGADALTVQDLQPGGRPRTTRLGTDLVKPIGPAFLPVNGRGRHREPLASGQRERARQGGFSDALGTRRSCKTPASTRPQERGGRALYNDAH